MSRNNNNINSKRGVDDPQQGRLSKIINDTDDKGIYIPLHDDDPGWNDTQEQVDQSATSKTDDHHYSMPITSHTKNSLSQADEKDTNDQAPEETGTENVVMTIVEEAVAEAVAATTNNIATTTADNNNNSSSSPLAAFEAIQKAATLVIEAADKKRKAEDEHAAAEQQLQQQQQQQQLQQPELQQRQHTRPSSSSDGGIPAVLPPKKTSIPRVSWEERLQQLAMYKQEHGNLLIPIRYKLNKSLGKFVHNTREQYKLYHKQTPIGYKKKCSLTAERISQLDSLGFVWSTERTKHQNDDWQSRLLQLKAYKELYGHCMVPHGYAEDPSFAEWVHRQRTTYASMIKEEENGDGEDGDLDDDDNNNNNDHNDNEAITPNGNKNKNQNNNNNKEVNSTIKQRMDQLRDMGFNFTVHSDKWMDHWHLLKEYKEKNGDCQVPTHYLENQKLGRWVHTQRHQRRLLSKGKKSCITQERIDLLDELGFSWEVRPSLERPRATWQQRLEELTDYVKTHDNFLVDPSTMPQLHAWCHEQRQRLRVLDKNTGRDVTKRMGPERVAALEAIGFNRFTILNYTKPVVGVGGAAAAVLSSSSEAHASTTGGTTDDESMGAQDAIRSAVRGEKQKTDTAAVAAETNSQLKSTEKRSADEPALVGGKRARAADVEGKAADITNQNAKPKRTTLHHDGETIKKKSTEVVTH